MNPTVLAALIAGVVSLVVSSATAYWLQRRKTALDYDMQLQAARLADYRSLWELTRLTSHYRQEPISKESAQALFLRLNEWYYEGGRGLLLSASSLIRLEAFMNALSKNSPDQEKLSELGTRLRTALTQDIGGIYEPLTSRRR
jgi:hypothetical protein